MTEQTLKQALEEYADHIHQRWLNARDSVFEGERQGWKNTNYEKGLCDALSCIENDIHNLLKDEKALTKANVSRIIAGSEER